jgi:hypothetical protein
MGLVSERGDDGVGRIRELTHGVFARASTSRPAVPMAGDDRRHPAEASSGIEAS